MDDHRPLGREVLGLGHVGLHVHDLAVSTRFWTEVMEFEVTDGAVADGVVFLSADPAVEHHMLLLRGGRTADRDALLVQQVSFRCRSLEAVMGYSARLRGRGVATRDISHGNAVGCYFTDPDGNRCEVYWQTGLEAKQVYLQAVDLSDKPAAVLASVRAGVDAHGATGVREDVPYSLDGTR